MNLECSHQPNVPKPMHGSDKEEDFGKRPAEASRLQENHGSFYKRNLENISQFNHTHTKKNPKDVNVLPVGPVIRKIFGHNWLRS